MQIIRKLFISLLFGLPLIFIPVTYLAFEMPKAFLLYFICSLILFFFIKSGYRLTNFSKIHLLYACFFIWIILTSIFGLSFGQSFWGNYFRWQGILSWICYSILFFISGQVFEDSRFKKQVCIGILISSLGVSLLAIIEFISLWFFNNTSQLLYSNRVISTFGQPNFLGAFLVMSLPFVWYLYKESKANYLTSAKTSMAVLIIVLGIFSTLSRSAYLGLVLLAVIWGFYHYRLLLAGIVFSVLLFSLLAIIFPKLVFSQWYRFQVDTVSKYTAENRGLIVQKSLTLIENKPLFGYGIENFELAFPSVVRPEDLGLKDIVVDSSHNLFLDISVQTGLVGLIIFFFIITLSYFYALKGKLNIDRNFVKMSLSVILVFIIMHQFSPVSIAPTVMFWMCLGIVNPLNIENTNTKLRLLSTLVSFLFVILTAYFILQTIRADILFRDSVAYEVSNIQKAISLDNQSIKIAPWINFYKLRRDFLLKQLGI